MRSCSGLPISYLQPPLPPTSRPYIKPPENMQKSKQLPIKHLQPAPHPHLDHLSNHQKIFFIKKICKHEKQLPISYLQPPLTPPQPL